MNTMTIGTNNENYTVMTTDEILATSQSGIIEVVKRIVNENKKRDEDIKVLKDETDITKIKLDELKKNTNVICSPFHSKRKRSFNKICKHRVWELFGHDKTSCEFVLFSSFLFKKIYGDIARNFDLDTWHDLSMENFDKPNSQYEEAKEFATYWIPSDWYVGSCVKNLIEKRDNGFLSPERCRALTEYLRFTENGSINPFA